MRAKFWRPWLFSSLIGPLIGAMTASAALAQSPDNPPPLLSAAGTAYHWFHKGPTDVVVSNGNQPERHPPGGSRERAASNLPVLFQSPAGRCGILGRLGGSGFAKELSGGAGYLATPRQLLREVPVLGRVRNAALEE